MLLMAAFILLALALAWRAFFYQKPLPQARPALKATTPSTPPAPTAQSLTNSSLILDLFNPTDETVTAQLSASTLKRQIEEALVMNFMLHRCGITSNSEYGDTYRALVIYAERSGLSDRAHAGDEINRINASASATYALLYAKADCDTRLLIPAAQRLAEWRNALLTP